MSENIYLGLSLGFNSSAAIVSTERGLLAAISQERINGKKNTKELPIDAALECIRISNIKEITEIVISHYEEITDDYFIKYSSDKYKSIFERQTWMDAILQIIPIDVEVGYIIRVPHHIAHAYSTFAFHGKPEAEDYIITSDGFGDGVSGRISSYPSLTFRPSEVLLKNSIALVYQFVTGAMGFKEHQHEGKITGLAAYGKPIYLSYFESLFEKCDYGNFLNFRDYRYSLTDDEREMVKNSMIINFDHFLKLKKAVYELVDILHYREGASREDIAASVQEFAEKHTLNWIKAFCEKGHNCYLAGGLFANVKINQRIKDTGLFNNVYVCPAMGDEGTAVGAALYWATMNHGWSDFKPNTLKTTLCGNSIEGDIFEYVSKNVDHEKYNVIKIDKDLIEQQVAQRLADNKIVCVVRGRMEFGPRALCHRSILYNCDTKETNDWLNKKLSRTEFMPFAPVCMNEFADDLFIGLNGGRDTAKLMTMTFDCTSEFAENYPAACHIDNTARPQIIYKEDDEFTWNILNEYHNLTGKKALINTSFNLHNWPIIATKEVALESWKVSDTDCLLIENVMIEKR